MMERLGWIFLWGCLTACGDDPGGWAGGPCGAPTACGYGTMCDEALGRCVCVPGFVGDGTTCTAPPRAPLEGRTVEEVCARWREGRTWTATQPYIPGTGGACDAGRLPSAALADAVRSWNTFRWLAGLLPVAVDPTQAWAEQQCAMLQTYAFGHDVPPDTPCYTPGGAAAAGNSMIALGFSSAADTMDAYMFEPLTTNLAHRRISVAINRDNVNFGFYNSGSCALYAYGAGDPSPPPFVAVPNPGYTPLQLTAAAWSLHGEGDTLPVGDVQMTDEDTGAALAVAQYHRYAGLNSWTLDGWSAQAGKSYRVTLSDGTTELSYVVRPVSCP